MIGRVLIIIVIVIIVTLIIIPSSYLCGVINQMMISCDRRKRCFLPQMWVEQGVGTVFDLTEDLMFEMEMRKALQITQHITEK